MKSVKLLAVVAFLLGCIALQAQKAPDLENGFKNYGSYDSSHLDTVNLQNGNLMLHAPLLPNYPQRGTLSLQPLLTFNSKTWQVICGTMPADNSVICGWFKGGTGVTLQRPMDVGIQRTIDNFYSGTQLMVTAQGYSLTSADGATHQLAPTVVTNGVAMEFETIDTTGYHVALSGGDSNGVPTTATITDRHGNRFVAGFDPTGSCGALPYNPPLPWAGASPNMGGGYAPMIDDTPRGDQFCPQMSGSPSITDSNGNVMQTFDPTNNTYPGSDTLGRPIPLGQIVLTTDYSGCVSTNTISFAYLLSYSTPDGTSRQIKMCFAQIPMQTAFNQYGVVEYPNGPPLPPGSNRLEPGNQLAPMASIVLADGTKWAFTYDNYGELTSVSLPTGGSISYTWTTIGTTGCSGQTQVSRAVATRTLNDGQGHPYTWSYAWGTPINHVISNTVTDPLSNDTVHTFTAVDGACGYYETATLSYQGNKNSGQLLKRVDTAYWPALVFATDSGDSVPENVVVKDITTTVYPSGKVNEIHREYDTGLGTGKPIFGNVKKELEYDWGQGTPGPLMRETDTTYQWEVNSAYLTAHLLDLPASVIVKDASGSRVAETDYTYDETAYLTASGVTTQHNSAPPAGVRGNQTTVSRWLNTTNSFIASHTNWYDTGEAFKTIDPLGHTTTYAYDPFYKGAYATQTCSPQTGSVAHCVSGTYDFATGVLTSLTNENATTQASGNTPGDSAHTSNFTYDFMFRITSAQAPPDPANNGLRAQTGFTFSSPGALPITVQRTKSVTATLSDSATNFFDGLARGYKGQHLLSNGTSTVDTTFDVAGHPATVSNPYFATSDPTYGLTTNAYDTLDRVIQTTKQDGSISSTKFNVAVAAPGDCSESTDEAGKQRRACSDGLGRLLEVDEPNPGAQAVPAQGTLAINGTLKSQSGVGSVNAAGGSGSLTITGAERSTTSSTRYCAVYNDDGNCVDWELDSTTIYDTGTITITVNGHSDSTSYGSASSAYTVASGLATAINGDAGASVNASAANGVLTLTSRQTGAGTNYAWSLTSSSSDAPDFGAAGSFGSSPASGALSGGVNGSGGITVYDSGTVTLTIGTFTASASYGQSTNSTAAAVVSALASNGTTGLNRTGSPVSAVASGASITLTYNTPGASGNGVAVTSTSQSTQTQWTFSPPSFTSTGTTLGNGMDLGDLNNSAFVTLYAYDTLGNLICVEQHGNVAGTGCSAAPTADATSPWRVRRFSYDSLSRLLTAKNPESGTISYAYDNDGELLQKTSPAPNQTGAATQTVSYCYDELHRVTKRDYSAHTYSPPACPITTPIVSYAYDSGANAKGHLTSLTDQAGTASYGYDILGRLTTETRTVIGANNANISKSISYTYNLDGSVKTLTYPSTKVITYTPDSAGLTISAVDSGSGINYVTGASYGPDSALTGFVSGSGGAASMTNSFTYNNRLQPLAMSATKPGQTLFSISYDFHAGNGDNGNVWGITNNKDTTRNQTFTYDQLNRLISAQNAGTDCTVTVLGGKKKFWGNSYGYDAWGNLLAKTVTKCSAELLSATADLQNRIHASAPDYTYDAAGNMLHDATSGLNYTWDQENRLTGASGYTYTYDGDGNRVRKSNGNLAANGTLYWYMTPGVVAETDLAGTTKSEYIFFAGERVARRDGATGTGVVFYYFSDRLKTASVITDSAGTIKAESDYYPWGGELQFVNNDSNDYKFTGKKWDSETGLDYFGARYYSNGLGRWVSADWSTKPVPVPYADFRNPQSLNLYTYVVDNPLSLRDEDGHADDRAKEIAQEAQKQAGSMHWAIKDWNISNDQFFRAGSDKCNEFVSNSIDKVSGQEQQAVVVGTGKIPTASQFADPNVKINGLSEPRPLSEAKAGDAIAQNHGTGANGNAEGHVGIVVAAPTANSPGQTASANANQGGKVTVNDWGFRNPSANPNNGERNGANSPPPVVRHPLPPPPPSPTYTLPL